MIRISPFLVLACTVVGCETTPEYALVQLVDEGELCFEGAGETVTVTVTADACLSSSCTRGVGGSCSLASDVAQIFVDSEIVWEEQVGDVDCTDDCGIASVTCTLDGVAAGTYDVVHGTQRTSLTVPVDGGDCSTP
ncbi:MAG: hypothetical protein AAF602_09320 [Myxococcota bacterium]